MGSGVAGRGVGGNWGYWERGSGELGELRGGSEEEGGVSVRTGGAGSGSGQMEAPRGVQRELEEKGSGGSGSGKTGRGFTENEGTGRGFGRSWGH